MIRDLDDCPLSFTALQFYSALLCSANNLLPQTWEQLFSSTLLFSAAPTIFYLKPGSFINSRVCDRRLVVQFRFGSYLVDGEYSIKKMNTYHEVPSSHLASTSDAHDSYRP